jgi:hypothetical protein
LRLGGQLALIRSDVRFSSKSSATHGGPKKIKQNNRSQPKEYQPIQNWRHKQKSRMSIRVSVQPQRKQNDGEKPTPHL